MRYNGINVPQIGATNEPQHDFFTRQSSSDYFNVWKYNAAIDNIWALSQKLMPFWIAGCNVTYFGEDSSYYYYDISDGWVFAKGLVYMQNSQFTTPKTNDIYVVRINPDGQVVVIDLASYSFDTDLNNNICKIGYVCKGIFQPSYQDYYMFLKNAPFRQYIYDAKNYYNGYGRYQ